MHTIKIKSIVKRGHQVASGISKDNPYSKGTLELQSPFFKERGLDLSQFYQGTLNLSISPYRFSIIQADFHFKNVKWVEGYPAEDFLFVNCQIEKRGKYYKACIYYPDPATKIGHFQDPSIIEILSDKIDNIDYGSEINIILNTNKVSVIE